LEHVNDWVILVVFDVTTLVLKTPVDDDDDDNNDEDDDDKEYIAVDELVVGAAEMDGNGPTMIKTMNNTDDEHDARLRDVPVS
jgi:hypothetical protein